MFESPDTRPVETKEPLVNGQQPFAPEGAAFSGNAI